MKQEAFSSTNRPAKPWPIDTAFLILVVGVFLALSLITHPQVLQGKVPFALDVATNFPPWDGVLRATATPHAEVGDSVTLFYPWRVYQQFSLNHRELPLWNPYILGGTPFLADAQSALFYPLHLLLLIQHPATFWTFKLLLNLALSGVFTAMLVRSLGGSYAGSIAAGLIFSCCGFMVAWQSFSSLADAAIWLPFILWTVYRLCSRPSPRTMVITAIAFAMPVLAGHPETAAHLTLMGWGYALWQCIANGRKDGTVMRRLLWVASAELLAVGISSVQIIPTLEWLRNIHHSLDMRWPVRATRELRAFLSRDILEDPNSAGLPIPESAAYVGPLALLLAPMAFYHRPRREFFFFLAVMAVSLFVVEGWFPVGWIVAHTPLIAGMKNWRMLVLIDFSLAVLAGLGVTALAEVLPKRTSHPRYVWAALLITGIGSALVVRKLSGITKVPVAWLHSPASTGVFLFIGCVLVVVRVRNWISGRTFAVLALSVLSVDMVTFRSGALPFVSPADIFSNVPVFEFLKEHADPGLARVGSVDDTYPSNTEMVYGLAAIDGYDLALARTKNLLQDFSADSTGISLKADEIIRFADRRLDLMNLRYLVATTANDSDEVLASKPDRFKLVFRSGSVRVFENLRVLPRATFIAAEANSIEVISNDATELARLKNPTFDPEKSVILPTPVRELDAAASRHTEGGMADAVFEVSSGVNESTFKVVNLRPGILLISQMFYPGWVAMVDGRETPVIRADYALLGVPLKDGTHEVKLQFRPASFRIGLGVSIASCLVMLGLLAFSVRNGKIRTP